MSGLKETSQPLRATDGTDLFVRRLVDDTVTRRWTFVVSHGLGEHSGRYLHVARWFAQRGADVYLVDHRGHGRSGGPRGHLDRLDQVVDDLDRAILLATGISGRPLVLLAHSTGGLFAIAYALSHPDRLDSLVLSAPALKLKVRVPPLKRVLARVLPTLAPRLAMHNEVDPTILTHDETVNRAYADDPLVHDRITARLYAETFARGESLISRAGELTVPTLLLHGAEDRLIDPTGTRRFFEGTHAPGRALTVYPGLFHEILNEPEQTQVFTDILDWLEERQASAATGWNPPP